MKAETLSEIRQSIIAGYLPENWHELLEDTEMIITETGYYSLQSDCVEIDGDYYHKEKDADCFGFDEIDEEYRLDSDLVEAHGRRQREVTTSPDNCTEIDGEWYVTGTENENGYTLLHNGDWCDSDYAVYVEEMDGYYHQDDVYYWDSDEEYHLNPESSCNLWSYHDGPNTPYYALKDHDPEKHNDIVGIGFEIEKGALPAFQYQLQQVFNSTGAKLERDGSVMEGFELVTPVYNLYSDKIFERLEPLKKFINVSNTDGAGGHINLSVDGMNDDQLLQAIRGWLPLIYSMYKYRLTSRWCSGKKPKDLIKNKNEKYQSVAFHGNYIELRIIGAVKNWNTLKFRIEFFRIACKHFHKSFAAIIGMAIDPRSDLYKLLRSNVYSDTDKFKRLITDAIQINSQFGTRRLDQQSINKITRKLTELDKTEKPKDENKQSNNNENDQPCA